MTDLVAHGAEQGAGDVTVATRSDDDQRCQIPPRAAPRSRTASRTRRSIGATRPIRRSRPARSSSNRAAAAPAFEIGGSPQPQRVVRGNHVCSAISAGGGIAHTWSPIRAPAATAPTRRPRRQRGVELAGRLRSNHGDRAGCGVEHLAAHGSQHQSPESAHAPGTDDEQRRVDAGGFDQSVAGTVVDDDWCRRRVARRPLSPTSSSSTLAATSAS